MKIKFTKDSDIQFGKLQKSEKNKVLRKLEVMEKDPMSGKKLSGEMDGRYSFRAWPYRIIYRIYQKEGVILVTAVEHRQGVYKN